MTFAEYKKIFTDKSVDASELSETETEDISAVYQHYAASFGVIWCLLIGVIAVFAVIATVIFMQVRKGVAMDSPRSFGEFKDPIIVVLIIVGMLVLGAVSLRKRYTAIVKKHAYRCYTGTVTAVSYDTYIDFEDSERIKCYLDVDGFNVSATVVSVEICRELCVGDTLHILIFDKSLCCLPTMETMHLRGLMK